MKKIHATFEYRLEIIKKNGAPLDIGEEVPKGIFIGTGKHYFIAQNDVGVAKFWVWLKA